jgi:hypothetical protein
LSACGGAPRPKMWSQTGLEIGALRGRRSVRRQLHTASGLEQIRHIWHVIQHLAAQRSEQDYFFPWTRHARDLPCCDWSSWHEAAEAPSSRSRFSSSRPIRSPSPSSRCSRKASDSSRGAAPRLRTHHRGSRRQESLAKIGRSGWRCRSSSRASLSARPRRLSSDRYCSATRIQKSDGASKARASRSASSMIRSIVSTPSVDMRCLARFRARKSQSSFVALMADFTSEQGMCPVRTASGTRLAPPILQ